MIAKEAFRQLVGTVRLFEHSELAADVAGYRTREMANNAIICNPGLIPHQKNL